MLRCLADLDDEGHADHALPVVRQMALGRAFDARQAQQLLAALGEFDRVEACCALFPGALLNPSALPQLLADAFADPQDRANVCDRLGIAIGADGAVASAPTNASRRALAAAKGKASS